MSNKGTIQPLGAEELKKIRGGETKTFSAPGFFASAKGDFVDIQQKGNTYNVTSRSSSNSDSVQTRSFSEVTTSSTGNSSTFVDVSSFSS